MGKKAGEFRWFMIVYIISTYLIIPGFFVVVSLIDNAIKANGSLTSVILGLIVSILALYLIITIMQKLSALRKFLPRFLRSWNFLPEWTYLAYYDR